ncbi:MAG: phage antirepressor protein [Bacillota bacterium]
MHGSKLSIDIEALLGGESIRRVRLGEHWLYSAVDLIRAVTERSDSADYWEDLKRWEPQLAALCRKVKVPTTDGTWVPVEMVNAEQALRLLQSVHSPRAERVKMWLAESGRQRMEEAADPELAIKRTRALYEQRGYSRHWIEKRLRAIGTRHELTGQWYRRGATENEQYRALTNELTTAAFGMDVQAYRQYKGLRTENLRDHMNDLELALTMLGETTASILHQDRDSKGIEQLQRDVRDAGEITSQTRQEIERRFGKPVVSPENNLKPSLPRRSRPMARIANRMVGQ